MPMYLNRDEASQRIDSGDLEVINGLISGDVVIGEAPEGEGQPQEPVQQEQAVVETPAPVAQEPVAPQQEVVTETNEPVEQPNEQAAQQEIENRYEVEKKAREQAEAKARADAETARLAREKIEEIKSLNISDISSVKVDMPDVQEDDMAADLAGEYGRNTRTIVDSIKESLGNAASVDQITALEQKLNAILELEEGRRKSDEVAAAERAKRERFNKLFTEVDAFSNEHQDTFGLNRSASSVYEDTLAFKNKIKNYLGTDDPMQIESAYRKAVTGSDNELVEKLKAVGVSAPSDALNYLKLAEVVDLKNGYKFNDYTGQFEEIKNSDGDRVVLQSIDDAYKLSRFNDIMNEAKASQAKEIEKKLTERSNGATLLPDVDVSDGDNGAMTLEEKQRILSLPPSAFKNNPDLVNKLNSIIGKS